MDKKREGISAAIVIIVAIAMLVFEIKTVFAQDYSEMLRRCEPYREHVEDILKSEHVNIKFYYLMVAESRCTLNAESDKGAKGFWQLMPSTSMYYGCKDPHNISCATRAAAKYIRHLNVQYLNFDDVIMAYNMGGRNYKRRGASRQAKGLVYTVTQLIRADGVKKNDN